VKFADILSEEEFVPHYDELSDDDDLPKQDIETKTDDDLVARISLLEDQLKERTQGCSAGTSLISGSAIYIEVEGVAFSEDLGLIPPEPLAVKQVVHQKD
jgi:hypothetical protein